MVGEMGGRASRASGAVGPARADGQRCRARAWPGHAAVRRGALWVVAGAVLVLLLVVAAPASAQEGSGVQVITDPVGDAAPPAMDLVRVGAASGGDALTPNTLYVWAKVNTPVTQPTPDPGHFGNLPVRYLFHLNYENGVWCTLYYGTTNAAGVFSAYDPAGNDRNTEAFANACASGLAIGYRKPITVKWACSEVQFEIPFTSLMSNLPGNPTPGPGTVIEFQMAPDDGTEPVTSFQRSTRVGTGWTDGMWGGTTYTLHDPYILFQDPPTGVTATAVHDNQVLVTWTPPIPNGAQPVTSYKVYRDGDLVGQTATATNPATSFLDTTLPVQTEATSPPTYQYTVTSVNCPQLPGGGEGAPSTPAAITPDFRPDPPTLSATGVTHESVDLSWTQPADKPTPAAGPPVVTNTGVQGYRVYRSTSTPVTATDTLVFQNSDPATTSFTDLTVLEQTTYYYAVQAVDGYAGAGGPNRSPFSNELVVTTPPEPTAAPTITSINPDLGALGGGTLVTITGTDLTATTTVLFDDVPAPTVTYTSATEIIATTPAGAMPGLVDVRVENPSTGDGDTLPLAFRYVAPPFITLDAAATGATTIALTWTITTDVDAPSVEIAGIEVHQPPSVGFIAETPTDFATTDPGHTVGGLTPETDYCFFLRVTDTAGNVADSAQRCATTEPVPAGPTITGVSPPIGREAGGTSVTITGSGFADPPQISFGGNPAFSSTFISSTQVDAITAPPGGPGTVDVRVENPDGQWDVLLGSFRFVAEPVVSLTVTTVSPDVQLGWTITTDVDLAGDPVDILILEVHNGPPGFPTDGSAWLDSIIPPTTTGSFLDAAPDPADACYRLRVVDQAGNDVYSPETCTTTPPDPAPIPQIGPLLAAPQSVSSIKLAWGLNQSIPVDTIQVHRGIDGFMPSGFSVIATLDPNASGFTHTFVDDNNGAGLDPNIEYCYRVRALNSFGNGTSNQACAVPADVPPVIVNNITPDWGPVVGGTAVTIRGENFLPGAHVFLGSWEATDVVVSADGLEITATTPPASAPGIVNVVVMNDGGAMGVLFNGFLYVSPPTINPFVALPQSDTRIDIAWGLATPPQTQVISLELHRGLPGFFVAQANLVAATGGPGGLPDLAVDATLYKDTGLLPDTQYCYRLVARDDAGNIAVGPQRCATTLEFPVATLVAVGQDGAIVTSTDGVDWLGRTSGTQATLRGVAQGDRAFLASGIHFSTVGDEGTALRSPDTFSWNPMMSNVDVTLHDIHYSVELPCATIPSPPTPPPPAGCFIAVGDNGTVLRSQDGAAWVSAAIPGDQALRGITLGMDEDGDPVWVVVGDGSQIFTSPNGNTWTPASNVGGGAWLKAVAFGRGYDTTLVDGPLFVAVGDGGAGNGLISRSNNTDDWLHQMPTGSGTLRGVVHNGLPTGQGGLWVVVGDAGRVLTSTFGFNWVTQVSNTTQDLLDVAHDGSQFIAVGNQGTIITSPDGMVWTVQDSGTTQDLHAITPIDMPILPDLSKVTLTMDRTTLESAGAMMSGVTWPIDTMVRVELRYPDGSPVLHGGFDVCLFAFAGTVFGGVPMPDCLAAGGASAHHVMGQFYEGMYFAPFMGYGPDAVIALVSGDWSPATIRLVQVELPLPPPQPAVQPISDYDIDARTSLDFLVSTQAHALPRVLTTNNLPTGATFTDASINEGPFHWTPGCGQVGVYPDVTFRATVGETFWYTLDPDELLTQSSWHERSIKITIRSPLGSGCGGGGGGSVGGGGGAGSGPGLLTPTPQECQAALEEGDEETLALCPATTPTDDDGASTPAPPTPQECEAALEEGDEETLALCPETTPPSDDDPVPPTTEPPSVEACEAALLAGDEETLARCDEDLLESLRARVDAQPASPRPIQPPFAEPRKAPGAPLLVLLLLLAGVVALRRR